MQPPPDSRPSIIVAGTHRYRIEKRLGVGASAEVFLARGEADGVLRAVKILLPGVASKPDATRRFMAEAHALTRLRHPRVIELVDVGLHAGRPLIVMAYAPGGSLARWVERHGALPEALAIDMVLPIADALEATHAQGIIHRDVKPHNILLDERGRGVLADFGIARITGFDATNTGTQMGTVGFVAPEQLHNAKAAGVRSDVFSLGVTLHTLLTGAMTANVFVKLQEPDEAARFHPAFLEILRRAVAYRPQDRFGDVASFRAELMRYRQTLSAPRAAGLPFPETATPEPLSRVRDASDLAPPTWHHTGATLSQGPESPPALVPPPGPELLESTTILPGEPPEGGADR